jgi:hypothetical protein
LRFGSTAYAAVFLLRLDKEKEKISLAAGVKQDFA